jgi:hypothetical protein
MADSIAGMAQIFLRDADGRRSSRINSETVTVRRKQDAIYLWVQIGSAEIALTIAETAELARDLLRALPPPPGDDISEPVDGT